MTVPVAIGLWATLILGLNGHVQSLAIPGASPADLFNGARGILPLFSGSLALMVILFKLYRRPLEGSPLFGPLGLAGMYGLVGIFAAVVSPDWVAALYWAATYMSVPLVLLAIVWTNDSLGLIQQIVKFNWLILVIVSATLLAIALLYLDFGSLILTPPSWFKCELNTTWRGNSWLEWSGGIIRPTGVGRYTAVTAIIAISSLWLGRWRALWGIVLAASLLLLLTSGARTAFLGFGAAAPLVILLHGGKKPLIAGTFAIIVVVAALWQTGIRQDFQDSCLRAFNSVPTKVAEAQAPSKPVISGAGTAVPVLPPSETTGQNQISTQPISAPEVTPQVQPRSEAAEVQLSPRPTTSASEVTPQVQPRSEAAEVQPSPRPTTPALEVTPQVQPRSEAAEVQVSPRPTTSALEATPQVQPRSEAAEVQPSPRPTTSASEVTPQVQATSVASVQEQLTQPRSGEPPSLQFARLKSPSPVSQPKTSLNRSFLTLTGRTTVWAHGWELFKWSPALGFGFHADRLLLGTHMHNALLHALVQTGLIGTIPLIAGMGLGWGLLLNALRHRAHLPVAHRHLIIQSGGILTILSIRMITESTGVFFGVDWLILAPILLYLQMVNYGFQLLDGKRGHGELVRV